MSHQPFIALTDQEWFEFSSKRAQDQGGRLHEVNFWQPKAQRPMVRLAPGAPVFFRLKSPHSKIAGYGFYSSFALLQLESAWEMFGPGNGDPTMEQFLRRIGKYRGVDLIRDPRATRARLGCTILRDAVFWPPERWLPWGKEQGWAPNIVQGKTEREPNRGSLLLAEIQYDHLTTPEELRDEPFTPLVADERELVLAKSRDRIGQGAFRTRLLEAYGRQCAITGEHTEIVLDAAHIQPYLGPRSNHVQNGLLLTKEFHTLFDAGYVTVTPEHEVRVSSRLRDEWDNGSRYYPMDGQRLSVVPHAAELRPSEEVLAWHNERVFRG